MAGLVASSVLTAILGILGMSMIAGLGFGYDIFLLGLSMIPAITILFLFGVALGLFTCAAIFRLGPAAEWLSWPLPMILSLISGVYYPINTLPDFLATIARLFPPAYVFESLRALLEQQATLQVLAGHLTLGLVLAFLYLLLAYLVFHRVYRHNLQTGKLARYNASI